MMKLLNEITQEHFYAMERLRDFLTFRFSDIMTTYRLMFYGQLLY